MRQTIYYLVCDGGDGSASVRFFTDRERAEALLDEDGEDFDESYNLNEGSVSSFEVEGEHNIPIDDQCGC